MSYLGERLPFNRDLPQLIPAVNTRQGRVIGIYKGESTREVRLLLTRDRNDGNKTKLTMTPLRLLASEQKNKCVARPPRQEQSRVYDRVHHYSNRARSPLEVRFIIDANDAND